MKTKLSGFTFQLHPYTSCSFCSFIVNQTRLLLTHHLPSQSIKCVKRLNKKMSTVEQETPKINKLNLLLLILRTWSSNACLLDRTSLNRSFGSILIYSICRISILLNTFFANSLVRNQFITLHKLMLTLFSIFFFLTLFFDAIINNRCDNREYDDILSWISFVGSFNRILNSSFSNML